MLRAGSWWEVLELEPGASGEEVRRAHKAKSLQTHPDKLGHCQAGAHEASVRVNRARSLSHYQTLTHQKP